MPPRRRCRLCRSALPALGARAILPPTRQPVRSAEHGSAIGGRRCDYDRHRIALGVPDGSRDLPVRARPAAGKRLRRAPRHRLAEGLLHRPGSDRPHALPQPRAQAAAAGRHRRPGSRVRHAHHVAGAEAGEMRSAVRRPGPRPAAPGSSGQRRRRTAAGTPPQPRCARCRQSRSRTSKKHRRETVHGTRASSRSRVHRRDICRTGPLNAITDVPGVRVGHCHRHP